MQWDDRIGRRLKLRDLHILLAIVQSGNMSRAARQLSVSNPVVTKAVADLEHALGVRLLDRTPHGVELTVYGRALLDRGLVAFDELRQAVKDIEFLTNPTAGEVRIGCPIAIGSGFVTAVIERLSLRYPQIVFTVLPQNADFVFRLLDERRVDLVINRLFGPAVPDHLQSEVLYDEPFVVAAGTQSPWARRRRISLADLMNEPWTLPPLDSLFGAVVVEAFRASGLDVPRSTVITAAIPVRHALLAGGRYLTITPASNLNFPTKSTTFTALPIELPISRKPLGVVTLKNRTLNPLAQLFITCAREVAKPFASKSARLPRTRQSG